METLQRRVCAYVSIDFQHLCGHQQKNMSSIAPIFFLHIAILLLIIANTCTLIFPICVYNSCDPQMDLP